MANGERKRLMPELGGEIDSINHEELVEAQIVPQAVQGSNRAAEVLANESSPETSTLESS